MKKSNATPCQPCASRTRARMIAPEGVSKTSCHPSAKCQVHSADAKTLMKEAHRIYKLICRCLAALNTNQKTRMCTWLHASCSIERQMRSWQLVPQPWRVIKSTHVVPLVENMIYVELANRYYSHDRAVSSYHTCFNTCQDMRRGFCSPGLSRPSVGYVRLAVLNP